MSFGNRLASFRKSRNLTQAQLADRIGIGVTQIHRYEADSSQPTLDVIRRLAKALGVSADELIFDPGDGTAQARILDSDLLQQFEKISALPERDRDALRLVLDAFIVRGRVHEITADVPAPQKGRVGSTESRAHGGGRH